ncbi:MAG: YnbE family lipoprotein [Gammaproteobacteria bacterium]|nr:YnbE family lipoprotein [Gammaproteobacteria bacterium]MDH4254811.1 YnbE family lipoprotein [Gammaproteobacteria bacterium]MDH5309855.1 YnbE family lipoprotein [Gammaproteobacteria bacterium]
MKTAVIPLLMLLALSACTPTVQVAAPKEPIEINLNVRIEHNIRVQVDKELEDLFEEDSDLF